MYCSKKFSSLAKLVDFKVVHKALEAKLRGDMNKYRNNNEWSIPIYCQTMLAC